MENPSFWYEQYFWDYPFQFISFREGFSNIIQFSDRGNFFQFNLIMFVDVQLI